MASQNATPASDRTDVPFVGPMLAAIALLGVVSLVFMPRSHWELDEFLFRAGIESFEPLRHAPHPPGYPLLVGLGKVFAAIAGDAFGGLRALAILSTLIGFVALAAAARNMTGSSSSGIAAAALFYFSCAQLIHSTTPMSDPPALMFLFVGLWGQSLANRRDVASAAILGAAFAASIGCRPQYAVAILPGLFVALSMLAVRRAWRGVLVGLACFAVVCLTWIVPLIAATGGIAGFVDYELGHAAYVAAHDAELSRGWLTGGQVWERFVVHPWGGRALSTVVLGIALSGVWVAARRRITALLPVIVIGVAHILFTVATSDPADGVRYALVFQALVAVFAAIALARLNDLVSLRWPAVVATGLIGVASFVYVLPVLSPRSGGPSPPVRAIAWLDANVRPDATILYDNSLRPHVEALLTDRAKWPLEDGIRQVWNRGDVEVWVLADGLTATEGSTVFDWSGRDTAIRGDDSTRRASAWMKVYRRMTRNHYGVVSVIPMPPDRRYLPGPGVFPLERSPLREEWRWLESEASITIPPGLGDLIVSLHVPKEYPESAVTVTIQSASELLDEVTIRRSESRSIVLPFPEKGGELTLDSRTSYVPRDHGARDERSLSIQLMGVRRQSQKKDEPSESPL